METKIHRRCVCGCGGITNPGNRYIYGHHWKGNTYSLNNRPSEETKKKMSLAHEGLKASEETKLKMSLSMIKQHPDDEYCEAWRDKEYKRDLRKDYCENEECNSNYEKLSNHHINLNKKDCRPFNVMTLCQSCHASLHWILRQINRHDILTINRLDKITYIHKKTRQVLSTIIRIQE